ncbi:MAG TPA: MFS transporter [Acetobacteraceae bacterium]|nr:MFS transporter [Acetobacteraceae bacterium]
MLGAACGGVLLTELGAASGFVVNAASFALIVLMLATLSRGELAPQMPVAREPGQIRQGLRYVCSDHVLVATAIMMLVVFPAAYNFQIAIALIVSTTLAGDGQTYGALMAVLGLGALAGSVLLTRWVRTGLPAIIAWTGTLAVAQAMASAVHSLELLLAACFAYGVSASLFSVTVVGTLQARTRDEMRGRVMALYAICFNGSVLWGGPAFGGIAQWLGVSAALRGSAAICALLALAAAGYRLSAKFIQSGERRYSADYQP